MRRRILPWLLGLWLLILAGCMALGEDNPTTEPTQSMPQGKLQLSLQGAETVTLEFGTPWQEPGAHAVYSRILADGVRQEEAVPVHSEGTVDETRLGSYTITYIADWGDLTETVRRTVHIVDSTPPEIVLQEDPDGYTLPGQAYREEGFTATDLCDGDLTDQVQRTESDGKVIYTVTDASGNRAEVIRTIRYDDRTAPQLELLGPRSITIRAGEEFPEPGYRAVDDCDGDITHLVRATGLDRFVAGTYTVVYTVSDAHGNTSQEQRTVTVQPVRQPEGVVPDGKVIYLTFDDGPGPYTQQLLEVLAKYNVKATFFVVGSRGSYLDLLQQMHAAGHALGIHSVSHNYNSIYSSQEAFFQDLYGMQQIIFDRTGVRTTLMRFPGGSSNQVSDISMFRLVQAVTDQGFQYFDWNVSSGDAGGATNADQVFRNVVNGVSGKDYAVVLQHDIKDFSVAAVERIIVWGLANGYTFLPLTPDSPGCHHTPAY